MVLFVFRSVSVSLTNARSIACCLEQALPLFIKAKFSNCFHAKQTFQLQAIFELSLYFTFHLFVLVERTTVTRLNDSGMKLSHQYNLRLQYICFYIAHALCLFFFLHFLVTAGSTKAVLYKTIWHQITVQFSDYYSFNQNYQLQIIENIDLGDLFSTDSHCFLCHSTNHFLDAVQLSNERNMVLNDILIFQIDQLATKPGWTGIVFLVHENPESRAGQKRIFHHSYSTNGAGRKIEDAMRAKVFKAMKSFLHGKTIAHICATLIKKLSSEINYCCSSITCNIYLHHSQQDFLIFDKCTFKLQGNMVLHLILQCLQEF